MSARFSLITCTLNRTQELRALLASLAAQTYRDFEILIVDQNPDDRLAGIIAEFEPRLTIHRLRSERGASRGRNAGIAQARGELLGFPDDDCTYPPDAMARIVAWFDQHPEFDGLTGRSSNESYWDTKAGLVNRYNVWKRGIEYTLFFRRHLVERVGMLDETLGVGAGTPWGSGEGADYLLRALDVDFRIFFEPLIEIDHPRPPQEFQAQYAKAYSYALGKGRVLHIRRCPVWFNAYQCMRPMLGAAFWLVRGNLSAARIYWAVSIGICKGWLGINGG